LNHQKLKVNISYKELLQKLWFKKCKDAPIIRLLFRCCTASNWTWAYNYSS